MKITLIQFGKTHFKFVDEGFAVFEKRLQHYCKFTLKQLELPSRLKTTDARLVKQHEGELLLKHVASGDYVILLDEQGQQFNSKKFATYLSGLQLHHSSIVFVIGGAFGFSEEIYQRANAKVSLSTMTFSHQLIRLIFIEQLYRAHTIIKGEPYHND